jgi:hypothetical protein
MLDKSIKRYRTEDGCSDSELHWQETETDSPGHSSWSKLPTELLYEIVAYVHNSGDAQAVALLSQDRNPYTSTGSQEEDVRQATLRALSQTSRILRDICLPLLWERVILPYEHPNNFRDEVDSEGYHVFFSRFDRIMDGLMENPVLAAYVRFVVQLLTYFALVLRNRSWIVIADIYPADWISLFNLDQAGH